MQETLSKFFNTKSLNDKKLKSLRDKSVTLRIFKNHISEIIYKHIIQYSDLSSLSLFQLIKLETTGKNIPLLTKKDMEYGIKQVYSNYKNKINSLRNNSKFSINTFKFIPYKINRYNKDKTLIIKAKGSLKEIQKKEKSTKLTKILNYMINQSNLSLIDWELKINSIIEFDVNNLSNEDIEKQKNIKMFFLEIQFYLNKYEERILKLVKLKKMNIIKRYWLEPIEIKSLSFKTQSRITKPIIGKNKNKSSLIDGFISLGGYNDYKSLDLPIKFNTRYHFDSNKRLKRLSLNEINKYSKVYNITFDENCKFKRIELVKEVEIENVFEFNDNSVGIDINSKHNLFYLSNNQSYSIDSEIMTEYIDFIKFYDENYQLIVNKEKTQRSVSTTEVEKNIKRKKLNNIDNLENRREKVKNKLTHNIYLIISEMLNDLAEQNINHLVMEDLKLVGNKFRVKNKEYDIGYGRMFSFINMTSLKDKIRRICHKRGFSVSFVPPEYTSQKCNCCKFISRGNRKTQEIFKCLNCDEEINADYNSSKNILEVCREDVLSYKFLNYDAFYCEYNRKEKLKKGFVKKTYELLFI